MDIASLSAICLLHLSAPASYPLQPGQVCPARDVPSLNIPRISAALTSRGAAEAIGRVAYAEAGNQGDSGLAGVVYTIMNRLDDGRWGGTLDAVLNAPHQFEPVSRVGGDWRSLRPVSDAQRVRIETIINLVLEGRLPDLTGGARFFQNPRIVRDRAKSGTVSPNLVNFGGAVPTAVIGAHSFFSEAQAGGARRRVGAAAGATATDRRSARAGGAVLIVAPIAAIPTPLDSMQAPQSPLERVSAAEARRPGPKTILIASDGLLIRP
jgi:hypothetical protein